MLQLIRESTMKTFGVLMHVLFGVLLVFAVTADRSAAQDIVDHISLMTADWTRAKDYTREYLDAIPEEGINFKPTPEIRSFAEQFLHLAGGNFGFASTAANKENPYSGINLANVDEYKTKEKLKEIVMESYDFVLQAIQDMDPATLSETVTLFGRFEMTRLQVLHKLFEHQTHHRGQTTVYLRLQGVTPPPERLF
jgi:uncharacterized damage-inducible protein DinB